MQALRAAASHSPMSFYLKQRVRMNRRFQVNLHREVAAGCEHCSSIKAAVSPKEPFEGTLLPDGAFITTPRETL